MDTELDRRMKAVQLYYYQHRNKAEICRQLKCNRPWLDRWLERYNPVSIFARNWSTGFRPRWSTFCDGPKRNPG
jgi:hypothetical protein